MAEQVLSSFLSLENLPLSMKPLLAGKISVSWVTILIPFHLEKNLPLSMKPLLAGKISVSWVTILEPS
jgi:hypothetical protein